LAYLDGKGVESPQHPGHNRGVAKGGHPGDISIVAVAALRGAREEREDQMLQAILIGLLVGVILGAFLILRWPEGI
jgi:hypothetical protein